METKAFYIEGKVEKIIYPILLSIGFVKTNSDYTNFIYDTNMRYVYKHYSYENQYHELMIESEIYVHNKGYIPYRVIASTHIHTTVSNLLEVDTIIFNFVDEIKEKFPAEIRKLKIKKMLNGNI